MSLHSTRVGECAISREMLQLCATQERPDSYIFASHLTSALYRSGGMMQTWEVSGNAATRKKVDPDNNQRQPIHSGDNFKCAFAPCKEDKHAASICTGACYYCVIQHAAALLA